MKSFATVVSVIVFSLCYLFTEMSRRKGSYELLKVVSVRTDRGEQLALGNYKH